MKMKFNFHSGDIKISSNNINSLREFVEDVYDKKEAGTDYPSYVDDLFFSIEVAYRDFHGLPECDYDLNPELK